MPFALRRVLDPIVEPVPLEDMKLHLRVDGSYEDDLILSLISTARERAEDITSCCLVSQQWVFSFDRFPSLWLDTSDGYGGLGWHHHRHRNNMYLNDNHAIILPRGPVLSVDSITYKDQSGTPQTLDPSTYNVDLASEPAGIRPIYNGCWPSALWDTNSIVVTFTCGYEQTVTETVVLGTDLKAPVSRQTKALRLTSAKIAGVAVTASMTQGILFVTNGQAGQSVDVVYQASSIPLSFIHAIKLMGAAWYENRSEVVQGPGNFNHFPTPFSAESLLSTYQLFKVGFPKG